MLRVSFELLLERKVRPLRGGRWPFRFFGTDRSILEQCFVAKSEPGSRVTIGSREICHREEARVVGQEDIRAGPWGSNSALPLSLFHDLMNPLI